VLIWQAFRRLKRLDCHACAPGLGTSITASPNALHELPAIPAPPTSPISRLSQGDYCPVCGALG